MYKEILKDKKLGVISLAGNISARLQKNEFAYYAQETANFSKFLEKCHEHFKIYSHFYNYRYNCLRKSH